MARTGGVPVPMVSNSPQVQKPVLLPATSTGQGGGKSVPESAVRRFPKHGANIAGHFSLPRFFDNFSPEKGITDEQLRQDFDKLMREIK